VKELTSGGQVNGAFAIDIQSCAGGKRQPGTKKFAAGIQMISCALSELSVRMRQPLHEPLNAMNSVDTILLWRWQAG
jgi:hypothetical protein